MTTSIFGEHYQNWINSIYDAIGPVAVVLLIMSIALIGGFGISRICKLLKIPYVTGYIILGILLGPSLLGIIPSYMLTGVSTNITVNGVITTQSFAGLSFIGDICMGFIAYSIGKFFKWNDIKNYVLRAAVLSIITSLISALLVGFGSYLIYKVIFNLDYGVAPALILGSVAMAISPTALASIIRQYKAKGGYVKNLFQVLIVADICAILVFTIVLGIGFTSLDVSRGATSGFLTFFESILPFLHTIIVSLVGILLGWLLSLLNNYRRTNDSRIILVIAFNAILVCLSSICKITPLLPCMFFGIFYYNFSKSQSLFLQLEEFLPPILCLFFVVSGAKLDFSSFTNITVVIIAILFAILRSAGHFIGVHALGNALKYEKKFKDYLPLSLMCMTSVAVGLMNLASNIFMNTPQMDMINYCYAIVLTSSVLLEIIGPTVGKIALIKTNSVDPATLITPIDPKKAKSSEMTNM